MVATTIKRAKSSQTLPGAGLQKQLAEIHAEMPKSCKESAYQHGFSHQPQADNRQRAPLPLLTHAAAPLL